MYDKHPRVTAPDHGIYYFFLFVKCYYFYSLPITLFYNAFQFISNVFLISLISGIGLKFFN